MAFLPMLGAFGVGSALNTVASPLLNWATQEMNKLFPVIKPTPNELVMQRYKGDINEDEYFELMGTHGFDEEHAFNIFSANRALLDTSSNVILYRRGLFDKDEKVNEEIYLAKQQELGLGKDDALRVNTATLNYETPNEIVLWLVREVLDPEKRKLLQLDDEFPEAALEFAKLNGIPEDRMKNIWAAHWALATPEQFSESIHRYHPDDKAFWKDEVKELGLEPDKVATDMTQLKDLLKFADVNPSHREKIASIAFNNLGRIETRWMIRFRFVELKEATYLYKRLGLPSTIAQRVAQVVFVTQSITDWKDSIRLGATTWEDVLTELSDWKITDEKLLAVVQRKVAPDVIEGVKEERDFTKSMIKSFYATSQIDDVKALDLLAGLNYGDFQRKLILDKWKIEKENRQSGTSKAARSLSKTDIKQRFVKGLISESIARKELIEKKYSNADTEKLIRLWQTAIKDSEE